MRDGSYRIIAQALEAFLWGGELAGRGNLPARGPAVFVSNHARALGPIAVAASLPVRIYPWVIGDMLDWGKAAAYLRRDFVEPQLHLPHTFSLPFARLLSQASVRLLRGIESIPVLEGEKLRNTFRISTDYLARGRSLLIFPEDPDGPFDEACGMAPFKRGFARLGETYFDRTGELLRFYPVAVHPVARIVKIGGPIAYNPFSSNPTGERSRIRNVLQATIREMYLAITLESYVGIPLPH